MPVIEIPPSADAAKKIRAAVRVKGNDVRLQRGGLYPLDSTIVPTSSVRLGSYGDEGKGFPVLQTKGGVDGIRGDGVSDVEIDGVTIRNGSRPTAGGVRFFNSKRLSLIDVTAWGCSFGMTFEGYGGKRCEDVRLVRPRLLNNYNHADPVEHCSGAYFSLVDGIDIVDGIFSENGWLNGITRQTVFNHGLYIKDNCGPSFVAGTLFHKNSSHGFQQRSGGTSRFNLFLDNPIGHSFGYINGSAGTPNGVTGGIANCVYLGGGSIDGSKRGYDLELGNIADASLVDSLFSGDLYGLEAPIVLRACTGAYNLAQLRGIDRLRINNIGIHAWPAPKTPKGKWFGSWVRVDQLTEGAEIAFRRLGAVDVQKVELIKPGFDPRSALAANFVQAAILKPGMTELISLIQKKAGTGAAPPPIVIPAKPDLASVMLFSAEGDDDDAHELEVGDVISGEMAKSFFVEARANEATKSIAFKLDDREWVFESYAPFNYPPSDADPRFVTGLAPGRHTLVVYPCSEMKGQGVKGLTHTIDFEIADPTPPLDIPAALGRILDRSAEPASEVAAVRKYYLNVEGVSV